MNPVNGCSVTCNYARPDSHMAAPLEKEAMAAEIGTVIARIEKKSAMTRASSARVLRPRYQRELTVTPAGRSAGSGRQLAFEKPHQPADSEESGVQVFGGVPAVAVPSHLADAVEAQVRRPANHLRRSRLPRAHPAGSAVPVPATRRRRRRRRRLVTLLAGPSPSTNP